MKRDLGRLSENIDYTLLITVVILCFFGLIVLYSSTRMTTLGGDGYFYVKRQIEWMVIGYAILITTLLVDYHFVEKYSGLFYVAAFVLLAMIFFSGRTTYGARRWLLIGPFEFQPSEFAKLALIVFLADFLNKNREKLESFLYFLIPFGYTGIFILMVFKQPDLGTSMVYLAILVIMLFVAGARIKYLLTVFVVALSSIPLLWIFLKDYQKNRIILFLNPNIDPLGGGYNVIQSRIAIGSGGLFGKGLFGGLQSQLHFLPAQHTDFIFSVVGEELGFLGTLFLLGLYAIILWRGIKIAREAKDLLGSLLASGAVAFLLFHILVNIGMALGVLPATGLPLPFLSYGGTFMISNFIVIGMLLNVEIHKIKM